MERTSKHALSDIDRDISTAETHSLRAHNAALIKQNELLKKEVQQLKAMQANSQQELAAYRKLVLRGEQGTKEEGEVLQMQHQRIFDLQTQLEVLQGKYSRMVKAAGSQQQTDLQMRCKELQRRLQQSEIQHQRQVSALQQRLSKQSALQFAQSKRLITSPTGQVKKSSLAVRKFV